MALFDLSQPAEAAAVIAGSVGILTIIGNGLATYLIGERKLGADTSQAFSDRAWADYELRRDAYSEIAKWVSSLFEGGPSKDKPLFHQAARIVRLVGSDRVVKALNNFTSGSKNGLPSCEMESLYRDLFNAMRQDIRSLHSQPPQGTELGPEAFPIES